MILETILFALATVLVVGVFFAAALITAKVILYVADLWF